MKDNRSKLEIYLAAAKRLYMWNFLVRRLNLLLVSEFPKSGASWFCQMLSEAADLPFPRNITPKFESSIMHGHHLFRPNMHRAVVILRDGRDVMVSAYFHFLFEHDRNPPHSVAYHRNKLQFADYDDVQQNMPKFINYMFTEYPKRNFLHFSWGEFVMNTQKYRDRLLILRYEELLKDAAGALRKALEFYGIEHVTDDALRRAVENHSFKKVSKRNPGEEDRKSFVRKGISGDWKNYFNDESCQLFKQFAGEALVLAGYERDLLWENPRFPSKQI